MLPGRGSCRRAGADRPSSPLPAACLPGPSAHHFQSADALSTVDLPASAAGGGGILAATFDLEGVAVWRLPPAGGVSSLGFSQVRQGAACACGKGLLMLQLGVT